MANRVDNQPQQVAPQQPAQQVQRLAPGGVGSAPTTMQPQQAPAERGYIERGVLFIRDCIVWLFWKIFCCFKKQEEPPAPVTPPAAQPQPQPQPQQQPQQQVPQLPPAQPAPDIRAQHRDLLVRLPNVTRGEDILRYFNMYFPTADEKTFIYTEIGKAAPRSWRHVINQSYLTIGQAMAQENPRLLMSYLIPRVSVIANP